MTVEKSWQLLRIFLVTVYYFSLIALYQALNKNTSFILIQ